MDAALRHDFLARFSESAYAKMLAAVNDPYEWKAQFRICETPVFFTDAFAKLLIDGGQDILNQIRTPEFDAYRQGAIPKGQRVPNPAPHPAFVQIDFAVAEEDGELRPKLIELQGFASMFCYQTALDRGYRAADLIPDGVTQYWSGLDEASYLEMLRNIIIGDHDLAEVVLVEVEPAQQRTRIDFSCTTEMIGIETVCLTDIRKNGRELFYERDGIKQPIKRIYNRVIFDELEQKSLELEFYPTDDVDVEWVAHPNWFLELSKHTLPFLHGPSIPECSLISELKSIPDDLENFVMKPLYSFAGAGVVINVTRQDIEACANPEATILQRKVTYAEFMDTPGGKSKAEVRLMYLWDQEPVLASTLVRVSRGSMSNVSKNTGETWIGATTGYHRIGL